MPVLIGSPFPPGGALVITAHPDDECMFFLPTIATLRAANSPVYLLCLSTGDADGLGSVRTRELMHAGRLMGIEGSRIRVVDDPALPDGLHSPWPPDAVAGHVAAALTAYEPATVVTFDGYGVSGHPNHQAVSAGVLAALRRPGPAKPALYMESTSVLRKFVGPLDLLLSACMAALRQRVVCCINTTPLLAWQAMQAHRSQFVWYRRLYIVFSRYVYCNTLISPQFL